MSGVNLSMLAIAMGLILAAFNAWGLVQPRAFRTAAEKFPRSTPVGTLMMLVATLWFLHYLNQEQVSDFMSFKPFLVALFAGVGIGACIFVRDFLPVRAMAVLFLLMGKLMTDSARWQPTEWRLVIVVWAYVWIVAGMWLTISPWRYRDFLSWTIANRARQQVLCGLRLAFGLFVVILGLTAYRIPAV